jgi:hypothetical protein
MANTAKPTVIAPIKPGTSTSFAPLKQVDAGPLNVGYAEAGPPDGPPVILLHGWPRVRQAHLATRLPQVGL